jgi:hypothetical protein
MWRKIESKDLVRGTCVQLNIGDDSFFDAGVIISVTKDEVKVARPYVFANENYNCNQPLMGAEVVSYSVNGMLESRVEVYEGREWKVRTMIT